MGDILTDGGATLTVLAFDALPGWADDDHAAAFAAFRRGAAVLADHPPKPRALGLDAARLAALLAEAARMPALARREARAFFETRFRPLAVQPPGCNAFFTGYYEPVVAGSRTRTAAFTVPLLRPPADLVELGPRDPRPPHLDPSFRFARATTAGLVEPPDRGAIAAGALAGQNLELVWLAEPVDAFFIHVQGAAQIALADGGTMRVTYAAKSGHPYTAIGRVLVERGAIAPGKADMAAIRAWLAARPAEAASVMATNRSYIFFREAPVAEPGDGPIAAAKVPLTAGRSLAVDRLLHAFHTPVWVETTLPGGAPFRALTIAQDTGSAIVGAARGDIFFGSGDKAGAVAGGMSAAGRFIVLAPREPSP
jgi:membrane-bound lytic murein transglycosylase A